MINLELFFGGSSQGRVIPEICVGLGQIRGAWQSPRAQGQVQSLLRLPKESVAMINSRKGYKIGRDLHLGRKVGGAIS